MRRFTQLPVLVVAAVLLVACGGDEADDAVSINVVEPGPLTPVDSRDTATGSILRQLFAGLVEADATTGQPELRMASSIETDDNVTWTIEIEDGWTFHDGSDVTAQSFADAWTATAQSPANSFMFQSFVGFGEVAAGDADQLAGVRVLDELTLEVELVEPFGPFLAALGDLAFSPLPEAYFEDPEGFATNPIGNGRYEFAGDDEQADDQRIVLTRYEDYAGDAPGGPERLVFERYDDLSTAYLEAQEGNLDILFQVPGDREAAVDEDFDGRVLHVPTSSLTFIGLPLYAEQLEDVRVRQALSLAIDRQEIIDQLFDGAGSPATSAIPPVIDAHREDACEVCTFDPDRARDLLGEAGGWDGPLTFYYVTGGDNEEWVRAVTNQWSEHLDITDISFEAMEGPDFLDLAFPRELTGPFALGWATEYLSPQYALDLFSSTGPFNLFAYESEEFDEFFTSAKAADTDEADDLYQQAEDVMLADLPMIPMWYSQRTIVWNDGVDDVVMDPMGYVRVEQVTLTD